MFLLAGLRTCGLQAAPCPFSHLASRLAGLASQGCMASSCSFTALLKPGLVSQEFPASLPQQTSYSPGTSCVLALVALDCKHLLIAVFPDVSSPSAEGSAVPCHLPAVCLGAGCLTSAGSAREMEVTAVPVSQQQSEDEARRFLRHWPSEPPGPVHRACCRGAMPGRY